MRAEPGQKITTVTLKQYASEPALVNSEIAYPARNEI